MRRQIAQITTERIEGPQISFWHWVLVFGPLPMLLIWLVARVRRTRN
jgi:hypothetical protein